MVASEGEAPSDQDAGERTMSCRTCVNGQCTGKCSKEEDHGKKKHGKKHKHNKDKKKKKK